MHPSGPKKGAEGSDVGSDENLYVEMMTWGGERSMEGKGAAVKL